MNRYVRVILVTTMALIGASAPATAMYTTGPAFAGPFSRLKLRLAKAIGSGGGYHKRAPEKAFNAKLKSKKIRHARTAWRKKEKGE